LNIAKITSDKFPTSLTNMVNLKVSFQSSNGLQGTNANYTNSRKNNKPNIIRILLVDDQNSIRQKLRLSLEAEPDLQVVGSVADGQTALEQLETLQPDIVLIDIEMPGIDGLTTAKIIKERFAHINVVIFSSYDDEKYIRQALNIGAKGYLLKNTPIEEIVHAIRFVHKGYLQLESKLFEKLESGLTTQKDREWHGQNSSNEEAIELDKKQLPSLSEVRSLNPNDWSSLTKELIDTLPRVWTRGLLYFLVVFVGVVLPWAMLAKVDETGSARGRLEPKGNAVQLDAPVAGTVTAIKVKEGQQVKAGSTLIELDSKIANAELQEAQAKLDGLDNQLKNFQLLKNQLQMNLRAQQQQNQAAVAEQHEAIAQTQQKIRLYQTQIASTRQLLNKDSDLVERYRQLSQEGVVSGIQLDDAERQMIQNTQALEQAQSDKEQQQAELNKQQNIYAKIVHQGEQAVIEAERQLKEVQSQIINTSSEITQTQKRISSLQHQLQQSRIQASIDGTVFQLSIEHPGAVVQASQNLARIAPKGSPLILKAQMPTSESGFLREGMPVKVKFDAYPFQDYGIVEGRLSWISPDSKILREQQEQTSQQAETFELEVVLDSTYIQTKNKRIALTPGQTATAEVIVRQRRLIDFVIDPFKKLQKGGLKI
jgi:HlyD family secretion protein